MAGAAKGGAMRRESIEEQILKDQPVIKDKKEVCALCGSPLEQDEESGELRCPVCDTEDAP
ncbi:hypothetical protein GPEL0_01f1345 [Geoanaerobacter pelophilus]|uniref:Uncharacterized protein n=2 Tax=Geoanaerobacter pelophilus TaxID=60036 RepID=A0ABQ0MGR2_9BACT|nr:hypothetical protein GPEL0_01f1345 [Geoanaerobacter pelophilus]